MNPISDQRPMRLLPIALLVASLAVSGWLCGSALEHQPQANAVPVLEAPADRITQTDAPEGSQP